MDDATATPDPTQRVNSAGSTFQEELRDAKVHAKHAARATLLAVRSAVDFVVAKLEDDEAPGAPGAAAQESGSSQDEITNSAQAEASADESQWGAGRRLSGQDA